MKNLTKKELKSLEIVTNPTGFTIWIGVGKGRRWIVDGSLIKESGEINLSHENNRYFAISNQHSGTVILKKQS